MKIPTTAFLENIECLYAAKVPEQYKQFCYQLRNAKSAVASSGKNNGRFITDLETFQSITVSIGKGLWADYEQAIADKQHPEDKHRLWGGLLPFYFDEDCVYGFSEEDRADEQVYVWSVHTIVHAYPSWTEFAKVHLRF